MVGERESHMCLKTVKKDVSASPEMWQGQEKDQEKSLLQENTSIGCFIKLKISVEEDSDY